MLRLAAGGAICTVFQLILPNRSDGFHNGGRSKSLEIIEFGSHDWLALEAWNLFLAQTNSSPLTDAFSEKLCALGTEVPDHSRSYKLSGLPPTFNSGYSDQRNHRVSFNKDGSIDYAHSPAIRRAREEMRRAGVMGNVQRFSGASFFLGTASHYLLDVGSGPMC